MRRITHSGCYNFITLTIVNWIDIFTRIEYKDFIIKSLKHCQKNKGLEIYAYVIMTNHLHLVVRDTHIPLSDILRDFKSYTSKELFRMINLNEKESRKIWLLRLFAEAGKENPLNLNHQIWQNGSYPVALIGNNIIQQKINYTHQNPVKAGFVDDASKYFYSSANTLSPLEIIKF